MGWVVGLMGCVIEWLFSVSGYWAGPWVLLTFSILVSIVKVSKAILDGDRKTDLNIW